MIADHAALAIRLRARWCCGRRTAPLAARAEADAHLAFRDARLSSLDACAKRAKRTVEARGCRRPRSVTCGHAGDRGVRTRPITSASRWSRRTPHTDPRANRRREDAKDWSSAKGRDHRLRRQLHDRDHRVHTRPCWRPWRAPRDRVRDSTLRPTCIACAAVAHTLGGPPRGETKFKVHPLARWSDLYPGPVHVQSWWQETPSLS